jgi:hypothetical protein
MYLTGRSVGTATGSLDRSMRPTLLNNQKTIVRSIRFRSLVPSLGRLSSILLAIATAVTGILYARHIFSTRFKLYDDEGYFLVTLSNYLKHGHLYTQVRTFYGPLYFYLQEAIFGVFRLSVTHNNGRLVSLSYLLLSAIFISAFLYRLSSHLLITAAGTLSFVWLGSDIANEPGHPQQLILLLLALASFLSLLVDSDDSTWPLFLLGAAGGAMLFTKINIGLFYVLALAQAVLCVLPGTPLRRRLKLVLVCFILVVPGLLMHHYMHSWAFNFCLLVTLTAGVTFSWSGTFHPQRFISWSRTLCVLAGLALMTIFVISWGLFRGIRVYALIDGVILEPARLAAVFSFPLLVSGRQVLSAVVILASISLVFGIKRNWILTHRALWVAIRLTAGFVIAVLIATAPSMALPWVVPFLPLSLIPTSKKQQPISQLFSRTFVTCMAAVQVLQAYPVAGTQLSIAAVPILLWAFVLIVDGAVEFRGTLNGEELLNIISIVILLLTFLGMSYSWLDDRNSRYPPSELPGTDWVHLSPDLESTFSSISAALRTNCSSLLTMPGMGSFNIWSGLSTPGDLTGTEWIKLSTPQRQIEVLADLDSDPNSCVLYNRTMIKFWQITQEQVAGSPLASYIDQKMLTVFKVGDYEIRITHKRSTKWRDTNTPH